jgi:DNA processing protein
MPVLGDRRACANVLKVRQTIDLDVEFAALNKFGARAITFYDPEYPPLLKQVVSAPPLLYVKGTLIQGDDQLIGVVGTRDATAYGLQAARQLTRTLVDAGWTIVSGLAKGIDAAAHAAAIRAGGRTLAWLGHGIDRVYPTDHAALAIQVCGQGALLTEFPIGTAPDGHNFPQRNRLISGSTRGVLIVEASAASGALGTARQAIDQGREVFAVPGSIFAKESQGTNSLIQMGQAKLVTNIKDILAEFGPVAEPSDRRLPPLTPIETAEPENARVAKQVNQPELEVPDLAEPSATVWRCVRSQSMRVDDLSIASGLPIAQVGAALTELELYGLIRQAGGVVYPLTEAE